jgi:8-oxo-dGTP diphosphatase
MELQVGVKVLLRNNDGKYLLLKRAIEVVPGKGLTWDIPGGRIDPGTTLMQNLRREVEEETGLTLKSEPRLIAAQDMMSVPGRHVVRLTYVGEGEGEVRLSHEHTEFDWVALENVADRSDIGGHLKQLIDDGTISRATA